MKKLLLVEDEALVGLDMEARLRQAGYNVIGPVVRLSDALKAVQNETFDGAILDINIKEGAVYPVADILLSKGVPFVLTTGYALNMIQEAYRLFPRLAKPFSYVDFDLMVRTFFPL